MKVLVPNIGSTSFKYRLIDTDDGSVLAEGRVERIGRAGGDCPDYPTAIGRCLDSLIGAGKPLASLDELTAVGFKAVHARGLTGAVLVTPEVVTAIEEYAFLLPAHNPPYVAAMKAFAAAAPRVPSVALFETAFFNDLPEAACVYAVPWSWREDEGIRRFGFHGASHRYASDGARRLLGRDDINHISCHLGGSSSLAAVRNGRAIDTSFGMTPQSGIPQNNRVGDIDAFAVLYMMKKHALGPDEMARLLSAESGLAGLSGTSGDLRDLEAAAAQGDRRARLAIDAYVYAVRRHLGAFLLELGTVDIVTFSGGIGEHSPRVRAQVLRGLAPLGIVLDARRNEEAGGDARISGDSSATEVWIVTTNEEIVVARAAAELIEKINTEKPAGRPAS
jgi:acetate kinase